MNQERLSRHLLPESATLNEVLLRLNEGIQGVLFLADQEGRVTRLFTDGDVRRALLQGAGMGDGALAWGTASFVAGRAGAEREENLRLLGDKIRHLPILDEEGRLVDLLTMAELWHLPVMEPSLGGNEMKYVTDCIASGWISSQGHYISKFEQAFGEYHEGLHALCVSNGTVALHLALVALGIGEGDEVLVPDLTFAATANVVLHCGAKPVFVDVDEETWTMDPVDMERRIGPKTKAVMPVHLYGHPCEMTAISAVAEKYGLLVVEDCAEALGAEYRGRKAGTLGVAGCFSFFANKVITTGEGGMVITRDEALAERMRLLRDHGMQRDKRYWHLEAGFNYRMTNLQAAIGLAQMEQLPRFLERKRSLGREYGEQLRGIPGLVLPPEAEWATNIFWLYSILINEEEFGLSAGELGPRLREMGIDTRPFFYPLHLQPPYVAYGTGGYGVTESLSQRGLSLPSANNLTAGDIERVGQAIRELAGGEQ